MTDPTATTGATDNLVEVRDLHFTLGSRMIYNGVDIDIARGRITAIMGPSGTGKTTLLRLISGQWRAGSGRLLFDGRSVAGMSQSTLFAQRKRMGMLFQSGALLTDLSVFDNVAFPLREHTRLPERLIRDIVLMKLEAVGLRGARDLAPAQLSGGMSRRVALARAIALDPEMIMYDEPFAGQDPISMGVLLRLIRRLNDVLGLTSIVVSHDVKETLGIADYVYVISDGEVVDHGDPDHIRHSESGWVQQFVTAAADGPVPFHYNDTSYADDLLDGPRA
ncbi:ABC transporter ATP-binding protein [Salinisphaera sp.]|uniref:ABC transporter ATP-binding protein n=1 Tax=Salinisphaera sp. TaxID=1914330 RepID=UPI002D7A2ED6|nr:ATP-binding cassette domain-containing protein [Salinisphaera sp.]HET7314257.1 ATP-binding cassette domain-containing protein [Salinisphaera sp.]